MIQYIHCHIYQKMSTRIYLYLYSPKNVNPNIFVNVFGPENHICHTLFKFTYPKPCLGPAGSKAGGEGRGVHGGQLHHLGRHPPLLLLH